MLRLNSGVFEEGVAILFVILLNFVSYEGALRAGLVFDDHLAIEQNPVCNSSAVPITTYVYPDAEYNENYQPKGNEADPSTTDAADYPMESPHSWKAAWYTDFWGNSLKGDHTHLSYRPITMLTYRFDHWMTNHFYKDSKPKRKRKVSMPKQFSQGETAEDNFAMDHTFEDVHDYHDPYRLHLVNIVLHTVNTLFFYVYLCRTYLKASRFASVIGASLFAVHPVHVESVTGIVGRAELICLFFGLIAFHAYFKFHPVVNAVSHVMLAPSQVKSPADSGKCHRIRCFLGTIKAVFFYAVFVLSIVLASLSKETGITIAAICLAYDFMLMWRHHLASNEEAGTRRSRKAKSRPSYVPGMHLFDLLTSRGVCTSVESDAPSAYHPFVFRVLSLLTIFGFLQGRKILLSGRVDLGDSGLIRKVENPFYSLPDGLWRKVSFTYLHAKNLQLLLWPYELCCEYGFDCIPAFTSFSDPRVLGIFATFAFLAYVGLHCFYVPGVGTLCDIVKSTLRVGLNLLTGSKRKVQIFKHKFSIFDIVPDPRICMGAFWLLAPYLPVSHLLVSVGTNIAERCLYIPSVGICLLATSLVFEVEKVFMRKGTSKPKKSDQSPAEGTLAPPAPQQSRGRSYLYYLTQVVVITVIGLGIQKTRERTLDWYTDRALFESSVRVCPRSSKNNNQLALSRWNEGRVLEGKELFETAATIFPEWSEPHFNLARYYYMTQDIRRAFIHLEHCVNGLFPKEGCIQLYFSTFSALFPNPNATQVVHTAQILEKIQQYGQAASQYRQAGLRFLQSENARKGAEYCFQNALRLHESGKITDFEIERRRAQQGEESIAANGDLDSRCSVLYWSGVTQMYQQNILGFCHHLHKLIRSCSTDPVDRITALQGIPVLMQQMPMLVESPFILNRLEKGYGRGVIVAVFGQWTDTLYMHLQSLPMSTEERLKASQTLIQAALDMTRLTFTSDEVAKGKEEDIGGPLFEQPENPFFFNEELSHLGTERMYSVEAQRVLRDALYMLSDTPLSAEGLPASKEDTLIFGATKRPERFNLSDYARNKVTNFTKVDDRIAVLSRKCMVYPALVQTSWRMGDIDEGNAVLDRCLAECIDSPPLPAVDADLQALSVEDVQKYEEIIRQKGELCRKIKETQEPTK